MEQNATELAQKLATQGYKLTNQRKEIWHILLNNRDKHLSIDEMYHQVNHTHPKIGIATIYRTIQLFEKLNLILKLRLADGCFRYQIINPHERYEHSHLICQYCGQVIDINKDCFAPLEEKILMKNGFDLTNYHVQLFGICQKCAQLKQKLS